MRLNLTPRLRAVAETVPPGARLADVGTDHAYLPAWLVLNGRIPGAVATDLRPEPLQRGLDNLRRYGVADRIELRLGDGLDPVKAEEVDAVSIAGMGGEMILRILTRAPWAREKPCAVQPMSSLEDLRRGLGDIGMHIETERVVQEGETLYLVMTLGAGAEGPLTPGEAWVGRRALHGGDPGWPLYFQQELRRLRKALAGIRRSRGGEDGPRRDYLERAERELSAWHVDQEG